ncbi:hypothetical protein DL770_011416 [Monosporascus sp. CRB-9-2]|nr:hypothetical protein DL770_011416 [Monosporascus sp. CRB-9-2]
MCNRERHHEHIEHRPPADAFDKAIEPCPFVRTPRGAPMCREYQQRKNGELEHRHHHAGNEDDCGQAPVAGGPEVRHPAQDRVVFRAPE